MANTLHGTFKAQKQGSKISKPGKAHEAAALAKKKGAAPAKANSVVISLDSQTSHDTEVDSTLPQLNLKDKQLKQAAQHVRDAKVAPMIHADPSDVQVVLRDFDLSGKYGPCVGLSRLERFERAEKMGLNPPAVVGQVLKTQQGMQEQELAKDLFFGRL